MRAPGRVTVVYGQSCDDATGGGWAIFTVSNSFSPGSEMPTVSVMPRPWLARLEEGGPSQQRRCDRLADGSL